MAKTKKEEDSNGDFYLSADLILDNPPKIISTGSPTLDIALNGGVPEGTLMIITSEPKIGKTSLGLQIMASAQKENKIGVYVDVEHRLKVMNLKGIKGLETSGDKFKLICSKKGDILSAEQILERSERALIDFPGCVMVFDSFSSLCPSNEQTNNYSDQTMGGSGKLQAKFMRRIAPIVNVNKNIVIGIVHTAANIGGYGGLVENVGKKLQYGHDIKLKGKKAEPFHWLSGEDKNIIGQRVVFECITSALGQPGGTATCWLKYGEGYSKEAEIIDLAVDMGIIEKGGAWFTLPSGKKAQGWDNVFLHLINNQKEYEDIYGKVKGIFS